MNVKSKIRITVIALTIILSMVVISFAAASSQKAAFDNLEFKKASGITTEITLTNGIVYTYDGALVMSGLENFTYAENIATITLYSNGTELLNVELHSYTGDTSSTGSGKDDLFPVGSSTPMNGYYSVTFNIGEGTRYEAFLTGLTEANLQKVQDAIIESALNNTNFDITDVDFIDTEKNFDWKISDTLTEHDTQLCWAAATSNMLQYTGWGAKAGFVSTDDIFEYYITNFDDKGGNAYYGLTWFFNGNYPVKGVTDWAQPTKYDGNGFTGLMSDYAVDNVAWPVSTKTNWQNIDKAIDYLQNGYGVGMSVGWLDDDGDRNGGHAITLWGYVLDTQASEKDRYYSLVISDSDSDATIGENRRRAPQNLTCMRLSSYCAGDYDSFALDYLSSSYAVLDGLTILKPYSEDLGKETTGTKNKYSTVDLVVDDVLVSCAYGSYRSNIGIVDGDIVSCMAVLYLSGNVSVQKNAVINYKISLYKDGGLVPYKVLTREAIATETCPGFDDIYCNGSSEIITFKDLPSGSYTLVAECNYDKSLTEAYYTNNTLTKTFIVEDYFDAKTIAFGTTVTKASSDSDVFGVNVDIQLNNAPTKAIDLCEITLHYYVSASREWRTSLVYSNNTIPDSLHLSNFVGLSWYYFDMNLTFTDSNVSSIKLRHETKRWSNSGLRIAEGDNSEYYTTIVPGATSLSNNEQFSFVIQNYSDGTVNYQAILYLEDATNSQNTKNLWTESKSLDAGSAKTIKVSTWAVGLTTDLDGYYFVKFEASYENGGQILKPFKQISNPIQITNNPYKISFGDVNVNNGFLYNRNIDITAPIGSDFKVVWGCAVSGSSIVYEAPIEFSDYCFFYEGPSNVFTTDYTAFGFRTWPGDEYQYVALLKDMSDNLLASTEIMTISVPQVDPSNLGEQISVSMNSGDLASYRFELEQYNYYKVQYSANGLNLYQSIPKKTYIEGWKECDTSVDTQFVLFWDETDDLFFRVENEADSSKDLSLKVTKMTANELGLSITAITVDPKKNTAEVKVSADIFDGWNNYLTLYYREKGTETWNHLTSGGKTRTANSIVDTYNITKLKSGKTYEYYAAMEYWDSTKMVQLITPTLIKEFTTLGWSEYNVNLGTTTVALSAQSNTVYTFVAQADASYIITVAGIDGVFAGYENQTRAYDFEFNSNNSYSTTVALKNGESYSFIVETFVTGNYSIEIHRICNEISNIGNTFVLRIETEQAIVSYYDANDKVIGVSSFYTVQPDITLEVPSEARYMKLVTFGTGFVPKQEVQIVQVKN